MVLLTGPCEEKSLIFLHWSTAHSVSAGQEIAPNRIGKEVNIFASNWRAMMASKNERGLVNFICTVFEQGDKMLTLLSMEKQW